MRDANCFGVRSYGEAPYGVAVVHGGPGAQGSASALARGIHEFCGISVLELLQSRNSIGELVEEMHNQLMARSAAPVILVGHSWGAWLSVLFAVEHPEWVRKIVLIGCGPLRVGFDVDSQRFSRFSASDRMEYVGILEQLSFCADGEQPELLKRLGAICERADTFREVSVARRIPEREVKLDALQYAKVWDEAAELRRSGTLLESFRSLSVPITVIHGEYDPHPVAGVAAVLDEAGIAFQFYLLPHCGHTPWNEEYAQGDFFSILKEILE